jgi:hypothetical protein
VARPECKSQRMTRQGTRGEGKREMVVSITGMSMGGVFLGRVGVFRYYQGRRGLGVRKEGRPRYTVWVKALFPSVPCRRRLLKSRVYKVKSSKEGRGVAERSGG